MPENGTSDYYRIGLCALHALFERAGVSWKTQIVQDIIAWDTERSVSIFLSHFGSIGSLNDVLIAPYNDHAVTNEQVPWANTLYECLTHKCYVWAEQWRHHERWTLEAEKRSMLGKNICGNRCIDCDYREVTMHNVDVCIAPYLVEQELLAGFRSPTPEVDVLQAVENILALNINELSAQRAWIIREVKRSGVAFSPGDFLYDEQRCPRCKSQLVGVFDLKGELKKTLLGKVVLRFVSD
ncbi:MAG: hypothetical protein LBN05_02155 [Oscillospiraceae bacterium]|jgi:hypothetical protein|nr:hypothetical protein [Oscillospiraceae bacterium]